LILFQAEARYEGRFYTPGLKSRVTEKGAH
jgi:hypothetical protein